MILQFCGFFIEKEKIQPHPSQQTYYLYIKTFHTLLQNPIKNTLVLSSSNKHKKATPFFYLQERNGTLRLYDFPFTCEWVLENGLRSYYYHYHIDEFGM